MISTNIKYDPQRNLVAKWNNIVFICRAMSLLLSCNFTFICAVGTPNSIDTDWHAGACLAILLSVVDFISLYGLLLKSRTPLPPPESFNASKRQGLIKEQLYPKLSFIIDLLALLPILQVLVGFKNDGISRFIWLQIVLKITTTSPSLGSALKMTGILRKNAWLGALQNLLYFIMISNGLGALYYNAYISMLKQCSVTVVEDEPAAVTLNWDELITRCTKHYNFQYGIFSDAFTTKIGTRSFIQRYTYCFAWGLKSLSSFGQIFSASSYTMDTFFSFFIVIGGLLLFGDLLARMQTALQCTEMKEDRQRTRQRMVDEWMKYHQLPQPLKKQVKQAIQSEWSTTQGINDEAILDSLPWDTRSNIRRHLYLGIIRTMPLFQEMDDDLINAICGYLRTFSSSRGTYVAFEGEPVHQMLFVFSGQLEVSNGKCMTLTPGDVCGKELLEWCVHPTTSTENLRPATQTIKCITDVDAFALWVDDVKLLAIQFHRDGKFRRAFQRYTA